MFYETSAGWKRTLESFFGSELQGNVQRDLRETLQENDLITESTG